MSDTPKKSALSRTFTDGGKTLNIEITSDGKGGWLLAVADTNGNITNWEDPFSSEQAALDEALDAIKSEGIDLFIGPAGGYSV